jgi:hypothetical protein
MIYPASIETARVPTEVTGEPEIVKPVGTVMATEVTVLVASLTHVPLTAKQPEAKLIPLERLEVELSLKYEPMPMPKLVTDNFGKVEVAVVLVAVKYSATTGPDTESFQFGLDEPMPTLVPVSKMSEFEKAEPDHFGI